MRKERTLFLTWLWVWICVIPLFAQQPEQLPVDPKVRYGKLDNGLTYYIRHNALPKERIFILLRTWVPFWRRRTNGD